MIAFCIIWDMYFPGMGRDYLFVLCLIIVFTPILVIKISSYERTKYCRNCNQLVTPTEGPAVAVIALFLLGAFMAFVGIVFLPLLFLAGIVFLVAIIYAIVKSGSGGRCPLCNSKNFGTPPKK